jgi:hypothetical protein
LLPSWLILSLPAFFVTAAGARIKVGLGDAARGAYLAGASRTREAQSEAVRFQ